MHFFNYKINIFNLIMIINLLFSLISCTYPIVGVECYLCIWSHTHTTQVRGPSVRFAVTNISMDQWQATNDRCSANPAPVTDGETLFHPPPVPACSLIRVGDFNWLNSTHPTLKPKSPHCIELWPNTGNTDPCSHPWHWITIMTFTSTHKVQGEILSSAN